MSRRPILVAAAVAGVFTLSLMAAIVSALVPTIQLTTFSTVTTDSVTLEAEINPQGKAAKYHFEYGLADCALDSCTSTPALNLSKGEVPVRVAVPIQGLTPGTTYHFRVVVLNVDGTTVGADQSFATYRTPAAGLPDNRAYEQASPVDKDGGDAIGTFPFVKSALAGGAVTFLSTSGVPGGSGAQELPLYLASRGEGSWSTEGLLPPADTGQRARVLGWTPDFSEAFVLATKFGSPRTETLLARSGADGSLATVAPYVAEGKYSFAGASADGSEVVFESSAKLPFVDAAIDGNSNVYAWNRASGELGLASVLNDGSSPPKGAFAGSYDWVRGITPTSLAEGGAARDYYTQDEHAVAADGSVFFTEAGTGQLYLRRNPNQEQSPLDAGGKCTDPSLACTIQISASQKKNGKGPGGTDAAGVRPATFMTADADGTMAFFASTEKLTDDATTGIEPVLPAIARAGIDGSSKDLSFLPAHAAGVAVDGSHLYWADPEAGTIGRASLTGAEVEPDFVKGAGAPQGVAVDGTYIYWTDDANGEDGEGAIGRVKLDGSETEPRFIEGTSNPQGIAVDATHVYWANAGTTNGTRGIARADIGGGELIQPWSVDHEGEPFGFSAVGVALDSTYLYFTSGISGNIERIKLAEPEDVQSILFTNTTDKFRGIAVNGEHVYWANTTTRAVGRAKLNNPAPSVTETEPEFIKDASPPRGLAIDPSYIYWSANQGAQPNPGNDLYRYDTESGMLSDLSVDTAHTNGAEVKGVLGAAEDGSYVYYAANGVPDGVTNTPNARGESASLGNCQGNLGSMNGTCNLYLWHEGQTNFISRLDVSGDGFRTDAANWAATPTGSFVSENFRKAANVAPDGRTLLFRSQRQLDGYDNAGTPELYRYRAGDAGASCVSCNPTQGAPTGAPSLGTIITSSSVPRTPASVASRNLAGGGNRVFFETTDALLASDTNGEGGCPPVGSLQQSFPVCLDVYEWEADGSGTCQDASEDGGCLYLLSSGKSDYPSFFADASQSGDDAFLFTRSRLVAQDQDDLLDVYDARVGGGLPLQNQPPPATCEDIDACHGPVGAAPPSEAPGSTTLSGPGDPRPIHHHRKRHHKKKHHKKARHPAGTRQGAYR